MIAVAVATVALLIFILAYASRIHEGFQSASGPRPFTVDLVIARYKENLSWLKPYADKYSFRHVWLYNKSDEQVQGNPFEAVAQEALPNVGTCDHTYLHHITKHYNNLADVTIFIPGSGDISYKKKVLESILKRVFETQKAALYIYDAPEGIRASQGMFYIDFYRVSHPSNREETSYELKPAKERPFLRWYEKWFPKEDSKYVSYWGVFSAGREDIRARPRSFYDGLLEQVSHDKFPEEAHYIERSWASMFNTMPADQIFRYNDIV